MIHWIDQLVFGAGDGSVLLVPIRCHAKTAQPSSVLNSSIATPIVNVRTPEYSPSLSKSIVVLSVFLHAFHTVFASKRFLLSRRRKVGIDLFNISIGLWRRRLHRSENSTLIKSTIWTLFPREFRSRYETPSMAFLGCENRRRRMCYSNFIVLSRFFALA